MLFPVPCRQHLTHYPDTYETLPIQTLYLCYLADL